MSISTTTLGIEHILVGADHIVFLEGLFLLTIAGGVGGGGPISERALLA